jgi:uncharacterized membrane protein YfcA
LDLTLIEWIVAMTVTAFAAAVQGSVGAGFTIVSVPILAAIDPILAPVPQLLVSVPLASSMAIRERGHIDVAGFRWILAGRGLGIVVGVWVLSVATQEEILVVIALLILLMVATLAMGWRIKRTPGNELGAGVVSGVAGLVASTGGPPLALLYKDERGPIIRSTLATLFFVGLLMSIGARLATGHITTDDVVVAGMLLVPTGLGFLASSRLRARVEGQRLRVIILLVSAGAAVTLLVQRFVP